MTRARARINRWAALIAVLAFAGVAGVQSAGAQEDFPAVDQPGVTDDQIRVAALYSDEGDPTNGKNEDAVDGANAYFEYVNETEGGVYGRELVVAAEHDDRLANNRQEVQAILSQDNVFAVLPVASPLFSGAQLLIEAGVPTFGWHVSEEWGANENKPGPSNFFGDAGGYYCIDCVKLKPENFVSKKLGLKNIGVVAFSVPSSTDCANGIQKTFDAYPTGEVAFVDTAVPFGTADFSAQVAQMVEADVELVYPCMDGQTTVVLAREMRKQGLDAIMVAPSLYNAELVEANAEVLEGFYANTNFTPFETRPKPQGLKLFDKWMNRTNGERNQNSMVGWINADLFVEGLKAAGPNFTQQKVVDAINQMTDYNAKGLLAGVDWTRAHEKDKACYALVKIVDGEFETAFGKPGKPFTCLPSRLKKIPAAAPDGTKPADRY
jgi:ABC-type branched-subunit amino acid transport system substrate-binding protein